MMKYPWKKDPQSLRNNFPQVLKKLETIEQRLVNQPEYANSYNDQIQEMEQVGFARKLTKEEMEG